MPTAATAADWHTLAACQGAPTDLFFPHAGEHAKTDLAKLHCAGCPVRRECLAEAHRFGADTHGIWGGTTDADRSRDRQDGPTPSSGRHGGARRRTPPATVARVVAQFRNTRHQYASDNAAALAVAAAMGVSDTSVLTWVRRTDTATEPAQAR